MRKSQKEIHLTSYDELLGIDDAVSFQVDKVVEVPLTDLHPFQMSMTFRFCETMKKSL